MGFFRLIIPGIDSCVAYLNGCHNDDLSMIGWIGEDLLVTGHAGVKDHFPHRDALSSETPAAKDRPVGKGKGGSRFVVFENISKACH